MPTVLITGANRGIGLEFARQYAADGWRVLGLCRRPAEARDLAGIAHRVAGADVTDKAAVNDAAAGLADERIDLLVNNAGRLDPRRSGFGATDDDMFMAVMRTNVLGPMLVSHAFLPHLLRGEGRLIATLTSKLGSIADNTSGGRYVYRASKTAVNMAMKSASVDLKERGVTTVLFHPGWVQTEMGGPNATVTPGDSVAGMRRTIAGVKPGDPLRFHNYDGAEIRW